MADSFELRVTYDGDQPRWFVACVAASAVRSVLDGWVPEPEVELVREPQEMN